MYMHCQVTHVMDFLVKILFIGNAVNTAHKRTDEIDLDRYEWLYSIM